MPDRTKLAWKSSYLTKTIKGSAACHHKKLWEPPHDKTNKMACAPSEDSDQPGHPPSLIRVFAVRMKKAWVLSYPLGASKDSYQTGRMPSLIWVSAGRTVILLVLSWGDSIINMKIKHHPNHHLRTASRQKTVVLNIFYCAQIFFCAPMLFGLHSGSLSTDKWAAAWQNQQNVLCVQRRLISLGIRPAWSEYSLSACRSLRSLATQLAHSEDSYQTGRMPRLIWVFAGRTVILLVLTWGDSIIQIEHHPNHRLRTDSRQNTVGLNMFYCAQILSCVPMLFSLHSSSQTQQINQDIIIVMKRR